MAHPDRTILIGIDKLGKGSTRSAAYPYSLACMTLQEACWHIKLLRVAGPSVFNHAVSERLGHAVELLKAIAAAFGQAQVCCGRVAGLSILTGPPMASEYTTDILCMQKSFSQP